MNGSFAKTDNFQNSCFFHCAFPFNLSQLQLGYLDYVRITLTH